MKRGLRRCVLAMQTSGSLEMNKARLRVENWQIGGSGHREGLNFS